jgi:GNAT superfamily N-acetyltransferase
MVSIRRAKKSDIPEVARLWMEMMREHEERDARFACAADAESAYCLYAEGMLESTETAFFLAEEGERILGYILALVIENPPVFDIERYGFVGEMVVTREYRQRGIGHLLWDRARRWFRRKGVRTAQLNVSVLNRSGRDFWHSVGFKDFLEVKWCDLEAEEAG